MENKDIAKEWFMFGDFDINSSKFLLDMRPKPLEIIAYHCQQCAEKYLKGFIAFHGGKIRKTHDLVVLNHDCKKYASQIDKIMDQCINLTDYGVLVRYPFHMDIQEYDIKIAIKDAEIVKQFIKDLTQID